MNQPTFLVIDLFCGFGGTTLGYDLAYMEGQKVAKVLACVNHDKKAINSHFLNHPEAKHFTEDIRTLELGPLVDMVRKAKVQYPDAYVVLWASLECTNHSKAKGGLPRDADSRTLACDLFRYQEALNPDYIKIENVVEFMAWGPLDANGKPISRKNGQEWVRWRAEMCSRGYYDEWKELNSANFGAYTSRNRLFGCFAKHGLPIVWPEPTHSKKVQPGLFGSLKPWMAVKDVLNLKDEGESIFNRKKPLCENTLNVIYKGVVKALQEGNDSILFAYYGNGDNLNSVDQPCNTIPTKDRFAKLQFIFRQYKTGYSSSTENPMGTLPTNPKANLITFILNKSYGGHSHSLEKPGPVIIARQDKEPLYLIRLLMDENGIVDIKMRMLMVSELLKIQGFPETYQMVGNQSDHKKFIGNSVVPHVVKAWVEAMAKRLSINFQKQA